MFYHMDTFHVDDQNKKGICIPITFNNPLKVSFSNKKYLFTIQTRTTQIVKVFFLLKTVFFTDFLKLLVQKINYLSLFV